MLIVLTGCSQKVVSFLDDAARFETFESYRIVSASISSEKQNSSETAIYNIIIAELSKEMDKRNYELSSVDPDLTLRYELASVVNTPTNTNRISPFNLSPQLSSRTIYEYVLLLELKDDKNKLVWQGSYDLNQQRKETKTAKVFQKAIGETFTTYPYEAANAAKQERLMKVEKKEKNK